MSKALGLAAAAAVAFCAGPALAFPTASHVQASANPDIQLVAGGCGRGAQPNWRGDCTRGGNGDSNRRGVGDRGGRDWHRDTRNVYNYRPSYYQPHYYQPGFYQPYYAPAPTYYYPPAASYYYYPYGW